MRFKAGLTSSEDKSDGLPEGLDTGLHPSVLLLCCSRSCELGNHMQRIISFVGSLALSLLTIIAVGCSSPEAKPPASPVGIWEAYTTVTTLELSASGQALMSQKGVTIEGKYSMLGDNAHVKLDFEFEPGKSTAMYGVIAGNSLSFVNLKGKKVRFVKKGTQ